MKLDTDRVRRLCAAKGRSLAAVLAGSDVSRNAYYSLARRSFLLPRSIERLADGLGVAPADLLRKTPSATQHAAMLNETANRIARAHKGADPDNIRHTLLLLEEKPLERLRRAIRRASTTHIH